MCKLVLIAKGTLRKGSTLDDLVSIHDDDVVLGTAYSSFRIVELPDIKASFVHVLLEYGTAKGLIDRKFQFNLKALTADDYTNISGVDDAKKLASLSKIERSA